MLLASIFLALNLQNRFQYNKTAFSEINYDDDSTNFEMKEIFDTTQNYLELIRQMTPTPPLVEYQARIGQPEVKQYEEPVQELINVIETDSRESTPDYQPLPVKDLISTFEQGKSTSLLRLHRCILHEMRDILALRVESEF